VSLQQATGPASPILDRLVGRRRFLAVACGTGAALASLPLSAMAARRPSSSRRTLTANAPVPAVDDLAASLDYDTDRIFRFVADEIRYEPYEGALRGPLGTLWARAGNSVDKALLLGSLLDAALVDYRYATGTLDAAGEASLLSATSADAATATALAAVASRGDGLGSSARPSNAPAPSADPEVGALLAGADQLVAALVQTADRRLTAGIEVITSSLAAGGVALGISADGLPELERTRHAWVQMRSGPDYVDLDPSVSGVMAGTTIASSPIPLDTLPDDLRHRVDITVILETARGGALAEDPILTHAEFSDGLSGMPITFTNMKPSGLSGLGSSIGTIIEGTTEYRATLAVGPTTIVGVTPIVMASGADLFGESDGSGVQTGQATAEWLEIAISSPGRSPVVVRRQVFDRIGPVARSAGAVDLTTIPPVELVDVGSGTPDEYLPLTALRSIAVVGGPIGGSYLAAIDPAADASMALSSLANAYHFSRDALAAAKAIPMGVRPVLDAPNITSFTMAAAEGDGGSRRLRLEVDILHRSFLTLPVTDVPAATPPGIVAGVVSHVAESLMLSSDLGADTGEVTSATSVADVFEAAAAAGIEPVLIAAAVGPEGPYPPAVRVLMDAATSAGLVLIAPAKPVLLGGTERVGWWQVDPATGRTTDQMDDGRGEMAEETIILDMDARVFFCFVRWGGIAFAAATIAAKLLDSQSQYGLGGAGVLLAIMKELARSALKQPGTC